MCAGVSSFACVRLCVCVSLCGCVCVIVDVVCCVACCCVHMVCRSCAHRVCGSLRACVRMLTVSACVASCLVIVCARWLVVVRVCVCVCVCGWLPCVACLTGACCCCACHLLLVGRPICWLVWLHVVEGDVVGVVAVAG